MHGLRYFNPRRLMFFSNHSPSFPSSETWRRPVLLEEKLHDLSMSNLSLLRTNATTWEYSSCFFSLIFKERCLINLSVSFDIPPLQLNTSGVNDALSIWMILALYSLFFKFSWWVYICGICFDQLVGAWGLKTLMSKNALVSGAHSPNALTSALAPSDLFVPAGRSSPVADCKAGSDRTSLHISVRSLCVVSLTALCLMLMKELWKECNLFDIFIYHKYCDQFLG